MKKKSLSMSLEHSILGLTDWNCRWNVQVSWASQGTRVCAEHPTQLTIKALCCGRSRVPWLLANRNFAPGCISGQKHQGSDDTPLGRVQQTPCGLSPWADGREMWVKCAVVVMIPVRPGTFTTPTHFTRHAPTFGPRTKFTWSRGTTLAGVSSDT